MELRHLDTRVIEVVLETPAEDDLLHANLPTLSMRRLRDWREQAAEDFRIISGHTETQYPKTITVSRRELGKTASNAFLADNDPESPARKLSKQVQDFLEK